MIALVSPSDCQFQGVASVLRGTFSLFTGHGSLIGILSASYASGHGIDPRARHLHSWKKFPSSANLGNASCQLLMKECAINTGKLPPGGLRRNSMVK